MNYKDIFLIVIAVTFGWRRYIKRTIIIIILYISISIIKVMCQFYELDKETTPPHSDSCLDFG